MSLSNNNSNNNNNGETGNDSNEVATQDVQSSQTVVALPSKQPNVVANNNQPNTNNHSNTISAYDQIMLNEGDAVFIGRGSAYGDKVSMHGVFGTRLHYDKAGRLMNPYDTVGNYVDPATKKEFGEWKHIEVTPGGLCKLPYFLEKNFNNACQSQQFAKAEYADQINEWYQSGMESQEIYEHLKQVNAVLMPKDTPLIVHSGYGSCTGCQQ